MRLAKFRGARSMRLFCAIQSAGAGEKGMRTLLNVLLAIGILACFGVSASAQSGDPVKLEFVPASGLK